MVLVRLLAGLLFWSELVSCQGGGWWETVVENAGISTMHAAVTHMGNVVLLDRTNIGDSELPLPPSVCRKNSQDRVSTPPRSLAPNSAALAPTSRGSELQKCDDTLKLAGHSLLIAIFVHSLVLQLGQT